VIPRPLRSFGWALLLCAGIPLLQFQSEAATIVSNSVTAALGPDFFFDDAAIGMLLGRVKRRLPGDSALVADLEEVRGIVQQTLEKIRTESRMLHPVVLDDFGLEKALAWYVEQYGRQHGIEARLKLRLRHLRRIPSGTTPFQN